MAIHGAAYSIVTLAPPVAVSAGWSSSYSTTASADSPATGKSPTRKDAEFSIRQRHCVPSGRHSAAQPSDRTRAASLASDVASTTRDTPRPSATACSPKRRR